jgi:bloom syndrome protein
MTKNNLGQHLAWLLNRSPDVNDSLGFHTRPDDDATTIESRVLPSFSQNLELPSNAASHPIAAPAPGHVQTRTENSLEDGDDVMVNEDMARLEFAPRSASRPRMLSCVSPRSVRIPGSSLSQRRLNSKPDTHRRNSSEGGIHCDAINS